MLVTLILLALTVLMVGCVCVCLRRLCTAITCMACTCHIWATTQCAIGLQRQTEWWRAYYHFSRPHSSLRHNGRARTSAIATRLTTHRRNMREFLGYPCTQAG